MSAYQLPFWVWPTALAGVCGVAAWRGDGAVRLAAAGIAVDWSICRMLFQAHSEHAPGGSMAADFGLLALYVGIALRSRRFWPLFAAGFQLLLLATHVGRMVDPELSGWAYLTAQLIWSYMVLAALACGAWTTPNYALNAAAPTAPPGATLR